MKNLFLVLTLTATSLSLFSSNTHARVEKSNIEVSEKLENAIKQIITLNGYSCKTIDSVLLKRDREYKIVCNGWNYTYSIKDKGGNWVVTLD